MDFVTFWKDLRLWCGFVPRAVAERAHNFETPDFYLAVHVKYDGTELDCVGIFAAYQHNGGTLLYNISEKNKYDGPVLVKAAWGTKERLRERVVDFVSYGAEYPVLLQRSDKAPPESLAAIYSIAAKKFGCFWLPKPHWDVLWESMYNGGETDEFEEDWLEVEK